MGVNVKGVIRTMFPFISAAAGMGGPLGIMAANAVGNALGIDKVDPADIEGAITTAQTKDPDALLKLQEAEHTFQLQMEKLGLDSTEKLEQIAAEDRANARAREAVVQTWTPTTILGYVVVGVCLTFEGILMWHGLPAGVDGVMVGRILGTLDAATILVLQYNFGSSAGSARKSETISKIATTP